jgi:hypothetical protein
MSDTHCHLNFGYVVDFFQFYVSLDRLSSSIRRRYIPATLVQVEVKRLTHNRMTRVRVEVRERNVWVAASGDGVGLALIGIVGLIRDDPRRRFIGVKRCWGLCRTDTRSCRAYGRIE